MADVVTLSAVQVAQRKAAMYSVQRALETKGRTDRDRSAAKSLASYNDNSAGAFTEQWANLTAWTQNTGTGLQVSGGRLYAGSTQNGGSCANHSYAVSTTGQLRTLYNIKLAGGSFSGNVIIGFSSATAGSAPATGAADARGLSFSGSGTISKWDNGAATSLGSFNGAKDYTVAVIADGTYVSVVASPTDGSAGEFRARWTQSSTTINNLFVFNSDTRTTTGASVGPVGAIKALSTITPRAGVEGVGRTVHWTQISGNNLKVSLPANYDSRIPSPLAICFHGNGSDENLYSDNVDTNATAVGNALNNAGYIVLTAAYTPGTSTWGAQGSLDAYYNAYTYARDNYNVGPVVIHADSMGGIESLLSLAERRIPGVTAWFGSSPTGNLYACYTTGGPFASTIDTAYGIVKGTLSASASAGATSISSSVSFGVNSTPTIGTGATAEKVTVSAVTGSGPYTLTVGATAYAHSSGDTITTYPTATAGHDPALMTGDAFRGIPMRFYAATDDTAVIKTTNADVLSALVAPYSSDSTITSVTGGHGGSANFPASTIVAFFNKYAA